MSGWDAVAGRIADALDADAGSLIVLRARCGVVVWTLRRTPTCTLEWAEHLDIRSSAS